MQVVATALAAVKQAEQQLADLNGTPEARQADALLCTSAYPAFTQSHSSSSSSSSSCSSSSSSSSTFRSNPTNGHQQPQRHESEISQTHANPAGSLAQLHPWSRSCCNGCNSAQTSNNPHGRVGGGLGRSTLNRYRLRHNSHNSSSSMPRTWSA